MDLVALACQLTGFFVWPIVEYNKNPDNYTVWIIPFAIFLTSFGWWENCGSPLEIHNHEILWRHQRTTLENEIFLLHFRVPVEMSGLLRYDGHLYGNTQLQHFSTIFELGDAFNAHKINFTEVREIVSANTIPDINEVTPLSEIISIDSQPGTPIYVFLVQVFTAWMCYIFGKFACKICIQGFSFAFPVNLTIPVSISLLITACGLRYENVCSFAYMPTYLFWECKNGDILRDFLNNDYAWIWLFWLLSQTWITLHIWTPKCERLASTEKLVVSPMYNSLLIDLSLALNRRRDDEGDVKTEELNLNPDEHENEVSQYYETISIHTDSSNTNNAKTKSSDHIVRIYATATMWHENEEEMMEMLKSILRMDEDQSARRVAQKYLKIVDLDYYEFETHIFFDDAFEISDENEDENVVNQFVKLLVTLMDDAATHVHQTNIRIRPPKKFPAPYGGRLVWTLPLV